MRSTRIALRRWNAHPCALLLGVLVVAWVARPDPTPLFIPGIDEAPIVGDVGEILFRNSLVTCFSLVTQAYVLGSQGATLAAQLDISPGTLLLTALPQALPELVALFLPLAAWTIASRRDEWHELLAPTFVTTAIASPILVAAATWEAYVWPNMLKLASPVV